MFGSLPCNTLCTHLLHSHGVRLILNLLSTEEKQKMGCYDPTLGVASGEHVRVLHMPIVDQHFPLVSSVVLSILHEMMLFLLRNPNVAIYIHCRGGHGRSAVVAGMLLTIIYPFLQSDKVLQWLTEAHRQRVDMRRKYYFVQCPTRKNQRRYLAQFVRRFSVLPMVRTLIRPRDSCRALSTSVALPPLLLCAVLVWYVGFLATAMKSDNVANGGTHIYTFLKAWTQPKQIQYSHVKSDDSRARFREHCGKGECAHTVK